MLLWLIIGLLVVIVLMLATPQPKRVGRLKALFSFLGCGAVAVAIGGTLVGGGVYIWITFHEYISQSIEWFGIGLLVLVAAAVIFAVAFIRYYCPNCQKQVQDRKFVCKKCGRMRITGSIWTPDCHGRSAFGINGTCVDCDCELKRILFWQHRGYKSCLKGILTWVAVPLAYFYGCAFVLIRLSKWVSLSGGYEAALAGALYVSIGLALFLPLSQGRRTRRKAILNRLQGTSPVKAMP